MRKLELVSSVVDLAGFIDVAHDAKSTVFEHIGTFIDEFGLAEL